MKVGLLVTAALHSKSSDFEYKSHEQIEKWLLYSGIQKSARTDVWKPIYKDFTENTP